MFKFRYTLADAINFLSRFKTPEPMRPAPVVDASDDAVDFDWIDLTEEPRTKSRGKRKGVRKWSQITGITLHQTAVNFGTNPRRLLNVPVHGATLEDGQIVRLHVPTDLMWHGNGFNRRDIGIEVSCRAAGIEGDERTLWKPRGKPDVRAEEATDVQLAATRELIRYYVDLVRENGGEIRYIHAHRQATKNRVSDPGSRIWMACGEWAREELGLEVGPPDFQIADGKPLPDAWTGRANGIRYNWQVDGSLTKDTNGDA